MRSFILATLMLIGCCNLATAAAITSAQTGNWSDTSTWVGGVVPGDGDTATIWHAVTVNQNTTIGASDVYTVNGLYVLGPAGGKSGSLIVSSGTSLTLKTSVFLNDANMTVGSGSTIVFDASGASSPSTTTYRISGNLVPALTMVGESGSHITIAYNNASSAARGYINGVQVDAQYVDFTGISQILGTTFSSGDIFSFQNCTFQGLSGNVAINSALVDGVTYRFYKNVFSGSTGGNNISFNNTSPAAMTSGIRLVSKNVFDKQPLFYAPKDFTICDNYFGAYFNSSSTNFGEWDYLDNNFIVNNTYPSGSIVSGDVTNNFFLHLYATNPHFLNVLNYADNMLVDGNLFEHSGSDGAGDAILIQSLATSGPWTVTITRNIVLPNAAGENSGTLFTALGSANTQIIANNNTYISGSQAPTVGETFNSVAGTVQSFKNNIAWDTSARGYKLRNFNGSPNTDVVTSQNADYNAGYNLLAGSNGKGYNGLVFSSGSPGAHDIDGQDPRFVDPTRDLAKWAVHKGSTGATEADQRADALLMIQAMNDPTSAYYVGSDPIPDLINYIREGFSPKNPAYFTSGYGGTYIGAVPPTWPVSIGGARTNFNN